MLDCAWLHVCLISILVTSVCSFIYLLMKHQFYYGILPENECSTIHIVLHESRLIYINEPAPDETDIKQFMLYPFEGQEVAFM